MPKPAPRSASSRLTGDVPLDAATDTMRSARKRFSVSCSAYVSSADSTSACALRVDTNRSAGPRASGMSTSSVLDTPNIPAITASNSPACSSMCFEE